VETFLGPRAWAAFGRHVGKRQGLTGGAEFFPWMLDGAPAATRKRVLGMLPLPVRLLYRALWAPRLPGHPTLGWRPVGHYCGPMGYVELIPDRAVGAAISCATETRSPLTECR